MPVKKTPKSAYPPENKRETSEQDRIGLERLIFFSDAVFAIAITLLVLELRLPAGGEAADDAQLTANLLGMWHKYLAYLVSFLVIGSFWSAHHRKFRLIRRYDRRLILFNLLILMVVAFIPFPSSVLSENGNRTATIFYALTLILGGALFLLFWWYASRNGRLIEAHLNPQQVRHEFLAPLITITIFVVSIGIAFFNVSVARLSWLLILPASLLLNKE